MGEPKHGTVSFWHERRRLYVDDRLTVKQAKRLLDGGAPHLVYPIKEQQPCPVKVGERFTIVPHQFWIEVTKITAKAGEWRVTYRIIDYRPRFMERTNGTTHNRAQAFGVPAKMRMLEGNLKDERERVDGDWHDRGKAEREALRIESRKQVELERGTQAAKSRLNRLLRGLDAPAQKAMLAEIERLCDRAERGEMEELKDAA